MVARIENIDRTVEDTANCLMLLSRVGEYGRVFRCKTCMKEFTSFQALGGHRASHKKSMNEHSLLSSGSGSVAKKVKTVTSHACPICGVEFPMGQALGGHMRRHRNEKESVGALVTHSLLPEKATTTLKKSSSGKRVVCLDFGSESKEGLNLNLELGSSIY
ncbi:hypothetical protein AALP_AA5G084600 [Arabis alpina]|uniref:C2H2-type domain-containing protein n=1 Tax=Arabis alpina TaxID=50452 RepID=A0A087GVR2_ARAAL|nr:hypothetical protein AALP_AA5G084600 [Arabis alpina]